MTNNDNKISEQMAIEIWEDYVGDSGKAPTNVELQSFANAVIETVRPEIEHRATVGAMPSDIYNRLMDFLLLEGKYARGPLILANEIKNLFGKSARKAAGLDQN